MRIEEQSGCQSDKRMQAVPASDAYLQCRICGIISKSSINTAAEVCVRVCVRVRVRAFVRQWFVRGSC